MSVGEKIWKSAGGETYMMTVAHIRPTIDLIRFNTYFGYVDFLKGNQNQTIVFVRHLYATSKTKNP